MMDESQVRALIQAEVRRQLNVVLHGETSATDAASFSEDIANLFPGMPAILKRPVAHPFGFVSRAVKGTLSVVARVGDHIGNRMVVGHRDSGRPTDLEEGEAGMYSKGGRRINVRNAKIEIGATGASEPLVLGNVLLQGLTEIMAQLDTLLQTMEQKPAGITTGPGSLIAPNPAYVAAVTQVQTQLAQIKSTYISTASSNIVSQESFTERGGS